MLADGLIDGDSLLEGLTLGDSLLDGLTDGEMLLDGLTEGEMLLDGLTDGEMLLDGLTDDTSTRGFNASVLTTCVPAALDAACRVLVVALAASPVLW
jgi:hypothetical protein